MNVLNIEDKTENSSEQKPSLILIFSLRKRIREIITVGLLQYHYRIIQADNSQEAHLKANQYAPDIVIIDISKNNIKDILMVNRFARSNRTKHTTILAIVPGQFKIKLDSLIKGKESEQGCTIEKQLQLLEFPFEFSELLKKISEILLPDKVASLQTNSIVKKETIQQQSGKLLFDISIQNEIKFKQITSIMNKQWAFPFTIVKAFNIISSEKSCSQDLSKCIETDLAASAAIIKVANTVYFAKRNNRINNVLDAIVRVGFNDTRNLLSCFALIDLSSQIRTKSGFTRNEFWMHSLSTGIIAQKLCHNIGYKRPELAFVSGLLHDLGKIPLDNNYCDVFPRLLDETTSKIVSFFESENDLMNFTHANLGHYLLNEWNFPPSISSAILNHHDVEKIKHVTPVTDRILQQAIFIANQLAKSMSLGHSCDEVLHEIPQQMLNDFKIMKGPSDSFFIDVFQKLNFFSEFLSLPCRNFQSNENIQEQNSKEILFVHGHHSSFHPIVHAIKYNGYSIKTVKQMTAELEKDTRVIISMPEPGRPLDIKLHGEEHVENKDMKILKIMIIDIDPSHSSAIEIDYNCNMIFINNKHLDVRLILHILDKFFFDEIQSSDSAIE